MIALRYAINSSLEWIFLYQFLFYFFHLLIFSCFALYSWPAGLVWFLRFRLVERRMCCKHPMNTNNAKHVVVGAFVLQMSLVHQAHTLHSLTHFAHSWINLNWCVFFSEQLRAREKNMRNAPRTHRRHDSKIPSHEFTLCVYNNTTIELDRTKKKKKTSGKKNSLSNSRRSADRSHIYIYFSRFLWLHAFADVCRSRTTIFIVCCAIIRIQNDSSCCLLIFLQNVSLSLLFRCRVFVLNFWNMLN